MEINDFGGKLAFASLAFACKVSFVVIKPTVVAVSVLLLLLRIAKAYSLIIMRITRAINAWSADKDNKVAIGNKRPPRRSFQSGIHVWGFYSLMPNVRYTNGPTICHQSCSGSILEYPPLCRYGYVFDTGTSFVL